MTFDEFIKEYNSKKIDYDKAYGVQCVDLAKLYIDKVLGIKVQAIGNAEAYWNGYDELSYLKDNFERIANTPSFIPQKGDLVIWGLKHGKNGHIGIAAGEGTTSYFYSYDENWGGKGQGMTKIKHTYKSGFEGVLRPKNQTNIKTRKFAAGQTVEINVPIKQTGAVEENNIQVESDTIQNSITGNKQFWIHKTVVKNNSIIARADICCVESDYMVQVFDSQFWIKEENITKILER